MTDHANEIRRLICEVGGLRAFEAEVRAVIGNTNFACLMNAARDVNLLLPEPERIEL